MEEELVVAEDQWVDPGLVPDPASVLAALRLAPHRPLAAMVMLVLMVRVEAAAEVAVQTDLAELEPEMALARDMVRVAFQRHRLQLPVAMVPATLMLAVVVMVAAVVTTEMEVVPALALDRPVATTLLEALRMEEEAAMVVAQLEVSLKVQVLELDLVLGLAPARPVALALMARDTPREWAAAWVAALVRARTADLAVVEVVGPDQVVEDTTKLPFIEQARTGPWHVF